MSYPPAPWILRGYALHTLGLVPRGPMRPLLPPGMSSIPIMPGKALALLFLAHYGPGSVLQYHELSVAVLARCGLRPGFWITHIYVDSPDSMQGGREIWGLPKQLAQFSWEPGQIVVRQHERLLCRLQFERPRWLARLPMLTPALSQRGPSLLAFMGLLRARLGLARSWLELPDESPFAALGLAGARRTLHYADLEFAVGAPWITGQAPPA